MGKNSNQLFSIKSMLLKPIDHSIIFQSSLPLLFEAAMPDINFVEPILFEEICKESDKLYQGNPYCGKTFDIMKTANFIKILVKEMYNFQGKVLTDIKLHEKDYTLKRTTRGLIDPLKTTLGTLANWCGGVATQKSFNQLFANQEDIVEVMDNIKNSVHENHRHYMTLRINIKESSEKVNKSLNEIKLQFDTCKVRMDNMTLFYSNMDRICIARFSSFICQKCRADTTINEGCHFRRLSELLNTVHDREPR